MPPSPRPLGAARKEVAPPAVADEPTSPVPRPRPSPAPRPRPTPFAGDGGPAPAPAGATDEPATVAEDAAAEDAGSDDGAASTAEIAVLADAGDVPDEARTAVWALVRQAQAGDAEAFGRLYDHYVTLIHRYVYHRLGDRTLAEDVTSETFVRALRRIDSLSFQGRDVGAWLVTIARNIIRDHVKSSRFRLEVSTADLRDADHATDGPEDAVVAHLTNQQLLACVRQLNSEQQECIVLRFMHGLSVAETAAVMGKKDGAIKALQHRAVRRLATLLPEGLL
jgi:RNA polymerase sigma-70 factor (TIGR02952 family)